MKKELLETWSNEGKSIADISKLTGKSKTSVRHWLSKYGIKTHGIAGNPQECQVTGDKKECRSCRQLLSFDNFRIRTDRKNKLSTYCRSCESRRLLERERDIKARCVEYRGGICMGCGLTFHNACYDFHHLEPEHKDFNIGALKSKSFESLKPELDKCALVCVNCHRHAHRLLKRAEGYHNKIKGNTELWQANRLRKLKATGHSCCVSCGHSNQEDMIIVFPGHLSTEEKTKWQKYNKTHWDKEFEDILAQSTLICHNCSRIKHAGY